MPKFECLVRQWANLWVEDELTPLNCTPIACSQDIEAESYVIGEGLVGPLNIADDLRDL